MRTRAFLLLAVVVALNCGKKSPPATGPDGQRRDPSEAIVLGRDPIPGAQQPGKPAVAPPAGDTQAPLPLHHSRARYAAYQSEKATFSALPPMHAESAARIRLPEEKVARPEAPLSLTATDGTGLKLTALVGKAVVQGPLAFTELQLTFQNPSDRVMEGHFSITLPQKAAVSRFAMKVNEQWQEAEVVELQRAREIYEDFLHRKQDPALLEKRAGNAFSARVFPIPANGRKELIISYSQELVGAESSYVLPLKGLPKMDQLEITAMLGASPQSGQPASSLGGQALLQQVVRVQKTDFQPDQDFVVQPQSGILGLRHGNLVLARLKPTIKETPTKVGSLLVLFDSSASRAAGFAKQVKQLGGVVEELRKAHGEDLRLAVACFDQVLDIVFAGPASGFGDAQLNRIHARRAFGASDLHGALVWAAAQKGYERLLLVTDGIATAGVTETDLLRGAATQLKPAFRRMDVLAVGGIRDDALLSRLVRGTLDQDGTVMDDGLSGTEVASRMGQSTRSGIGVQIPGADWTWPAQLDGIQSGDEVLVYADVRDGTLAPGAPLQVTLAGLTSDTISVPLAEVKRPLLERAWVKARMARLQHQGDTAAAGDPDMRAAIQQQIVNLSKKFRVLCDETALLVLETEWDYRRYNIERNALADILTVGATGVELLQRTGPVVSQPIPQAPVTTMPPRRFKTPVSGSMGSRGGDSLIDLGSSMASAPTPMRRAVATRDPADEPRDSAMAARSSAGGAPDLSASRRMQTFSQNEAKAEGGRMVLRSAASDSAARPPATAPAERVAKLRERRWDTTRRIPVTRRPTDDELRPPPPPPRDDVVNRNAADDPPEKRPPFTGRMKTVKDLLAKNNANGALIEALTWWTAEPGDVMALVALGDCLEFIREYTLAARVYGSIIDLYPQRADLRRFAGERLEALGKYGQALAADTYAQAARQRPDHPGSHRLLAYALLRLGHVDAAYEAISDGLRRKYPAGRFAGVEEILREDLGLFTAVLMARDPKRQTDLEARLSQFNAPYAAGPSLRFVLYWETDANDVDFHIHDGAKDHAFYQNRNLRSGGTLYNDVTTGYGPECFAIKGKPRGYPYNLQIHYFARGPMGYGMGKLEVIEHDGRGNLAFKQIPYVVQNDGAFLDLGTIKSSLFGK